MSRLLLIAAHYALAASPPPTCQRALTAACSSLSPSECVVCIGAHQHQLRAASCNAADVAQFCKSAAPTCRVQAGVECKQPRYYDEVEAADPGECCQRCGEDEQCKFWTFKASDVGSGNPCQRFASTPVVNKSSSSFVSGSAPDMPPSSASKVRLRVSGPKLLDQQGHEVRLVGFNWQLNHVQSAPFSDGDLMKKVLPSANLARIVGVLWDNSRDATGKLSGNDCMTDTAPFWKESCFSKLDNAVRQATAAKIWVVLAARAEYAAGQNYQSDPDSTVFHNATLRTMFYTMWKHVAAHYASWDYIAAYEVMAEPRDKDASPALVRSFYVDACDAVQSVAPGTPCMVGPGPYYKLW
jgi:hypothetical protein